MSPWGKAILRAWTRERRFVDMPNRDCWSPDSHDDADFGFDQAAPQHPADGALDPLAAFIKELSGMTSPDVSDITDDRPIPQQQETESMTVNEAVQVSH